MLVWVSRDGGGVVNGVFSLRQPGLAEEQIDDQSADVLAFTGPAAVTGRLRSAAKGLLTDPGPVPKLVKGLADVAVSEVNILREAVNALSARLAAYDNAVAGATSLADLKSKWNAAATNNPLPATLADRTNQQLRNAVSGDIDGGSAD